MSTWHGAPGGQRTHVLEGAVAWAHSRPAVVEHAAFAEGQRGGAVQQVAGGAQTAFAGRMKLVFISIVATPGPSMASPARLGRVRSDRVLRAAWAMATSSSVISTPPCATSQ